jgi:3-isopropylmalate dehydratase small subunit
MKALKKITSTFIPLPEENIDTDQIIPARFLKSTSREGFGTGVIIITTKHNRKPILF